MTHLILRSRIFDENAFIRAVEMHANDLRSYAKHQELLDQGKADYYPPPSAQADIDASVRRPDFVPDYAFVDQFSIQHGDIKAFNLRKDELRQQIASMENVAISAILPRGKWRLKNIEYQIASGKPSVERTPSDLAIIAEQEERMAKVININLHHARLESEIEDLTFDTINQWVPIPYQT